MVRTCETRTSSEQETIDLGLAIGEFLRPGDIVLIEGDLGTGKTRLAKGIVSVAAGVPQDDVVSPTFTLINTFEGPFPVHHADLYRLTPGQVEGIGLEEALEDGAVVVEWAEKIRDIGDDPLCVSIRSTEDEESRLVSLSWNENGSWPERIARALKLKE